LQKSANELRALPRVLARMVLSGASSSPEFGP
jgi:hypothetical protein